MRWDDNEIWRGLRNNYRREDASAALVTQYRNRLLGFLSKICRTKEDAEEVLSDVFYKAVMELRRLHTPPKSLSAWLHRIALNAARDRLRRQKRDSPLWNALPFDDQKLASISNKEEESLNRARTQARDSAIAVALSRLQSEDPRYCALIVMDVMSQCDRPFTAEQTGIKQKQISAHLKRALGKFRKIALEFPALVELMQRNTPGEDS